MKLPRLKAWHFGRPKHGIIETSYYSQGLLHQLVVYDTLYITDIITVESQSLL